MALNIATKRKGDKLTAEEFNSIVAEINVTGDGLDGKLDGFDTAKEGFYVTDGSGNVGLQYTETDGLDAAALSPHILELINSGIGGSGSGPGTTYEKIVDSTGEAVIGKYKYEDTDGAVILLPLYERIVTVQASSLTAGTSVTASFPFLDLIDYKKYVVINNVAVHSSSGEIVYGNVFNKASLENTSGGLRLVLTPSQTVSSISAIHVTLNYVKVDDGTEYRGFEFTVEDGSIPDIDSLGIGFAALKYGKEIAMTVSIDDNATDGYARFFALFNGRDLASTSNGVTYGQNQWLAGKLPTLKSKGLSTVTYDIPMTTDSCGLDKRFCFTAIFMPQPYYNGTPRCLLCSNLDTLYSGSTNSHYSNYQEIYLYGNSLGSHNVNENDAKQIDYLGTMFNLPKGVKGDHATLSPCFEMDDTLYKIFGLHGCRMHAIPDGDKAGYGHAARLFKKFSCYTVASPATNLAYWQSGDAYGSLAAYIKWFTGSSNEYNNIDLPPYNTSYNEQFYINSIGRGWFDDGGLSTFVTDFANELTIPDVENRRFMVLGTHNAIDVKINMLRDFSTAYGKGGADIMWVPSLLEFFDYYRVRKYSKIRVYKEGARFHIKIYMPTKDANGNPLEFTDATLTMNLTASSVITFPEGQDRLMNVTYNKAKGIVNVYGDSRIITTIDTLISRVRETSVSYVRGTYLNDLGYFVSQLKPELANYYSSIIDNL